MGEGPKLHGPDVARDRSLKGPVPAVKAVRMNMAQAAYEQHPALPLIPGDVSSTIQRVALPTTPEGMDSDETVQKITEREACEVEEQVRLDKLYMAELEGTARRGDRATLRQGMISVRDVNTVRSEYGSTVLHIAAEQNDTVMIRWLIGKGADVHAMDQFGETPLHYAAASDAVECTILLLEAGAEVDSRSKTGQTPFHRAVECMAPRTAQFLLNHGADVRAVDNEGHDALYWATSIEADMHEVEDIVRAALEIGHGRAREAGEADLVDDPSRD